MKLLESRVWVVLQVTRGRSEVTAVFTEESHAEKFIEKMKVHGTFSLQEATLYNFAPPDWGTIQ